MSSDSKISAFTVHMLSNSLQIYFFHSGEQIKKYPDSLPNSPGACGWRLYPERKSCGFKNIWIRVDGALITEHPTGILIGQYLTEIKTKSDRKSSNFNF